jgi:hypothetical protein
LLGGWRRSKSKLERLNKIEKLHVPIEHFIERNFFRPWLNSSSIFQLHWQLMSYNRQSWSAIEMRMVTSEASFTLIVCRIGRNRTPWQNLAGTELNLSPYTFVRTESPVISRVFMSNVRFPFEADLVSVPRN